MPAVVEKIAAKLPKSHVVHSLKTAEELYAPPYNFHPDGETTAWSNTASPCRCRMIKNADGTRVAFQVELRPEGVAVVQDKNMQVALNTSFTDARTGLAAETFTPDTRRTYTPGQMAARVTVPISVDLVSPETSEITCQSVQVSVTMPREDGAWAIDVSRWVWYFGEAAAKGPRLSHLPLHIQQQRRDERKNLRARGLTPDYASTVGTSDLRRGIGRSLLKVTKKVFSAPPGAGIPVHYAPEPFEELDGPQSQTFGSSLARKFSYTDSYASPSEYEHIRTDTKVSGLTSESAWA